MKFHYSALFVLFFLFTCKYSLTDIPETNVEKPSIADASILFELQPDKDTIKLFEPTTLFYNVNTLKKALYEVEFYIDNELLTSQNYFSNLPYELYFNTNNYNDGTYKFSVKLYTNTNTGSLADNLGAEVFIFQLDWTMIIDKTIPKELNFISIDSVQNGVKLVWEEFDHASFSNYQITRSSQVTSDTKVIFNIDNPKKNWFIDSTYVEGDYVTYEIKLNNLWGERREYCQIPKEPYIKVIEGCNADIIWQKVRYPQALAFYYLYTALNSSNVNENEKIYDAKITSKNVNIPFGSEQYFGIMYAPYGAVFFFNMRKGETYYTLGEKMPAHDYMQRIRNTPYILLHQGNRVFKYKMETDEFLDSIDAIFDISWKCILSYDCNYFGYSENNEFYLRNTNDLSIVSKLSSPVYDGNSGNLYTYAISNNKKLLAVYKDKSMKLFDLESGTLIDVHKTDAIATFFANLSSDGRYIAAVEYSNPITLRYYEVVNNEIVEIRKEIISGYNYADLRYSFGAFDEVYILYQGKLEIRNKTDFSINRVIDLPSGSLIRTSHEHMITIVQDNAPSKKAFLVDMHNGQILQEIYLDGSSYISLQGKYLTSGIGRKLYLNNIK